MADETRNTVGGGAHVGFVAQAHHLELRLADGSTQPPPRQLRGADHCFQNRAPEIGRVVRLVEEPATDDRVGAARTVVLAGGPGSGKSALATEMGHRIADAYPDGVLCEDLAEYRDPDGLVDLADLVGSLLRGLGVPRSFLPDHQGQRLGEYHSRTAGRRMLIILDDVAHPDEVRSLVPNAAGSLLLVTTDQPTRPLLAETGGVEIVVGPLAERHAAALLTTFVGERRAAREADTLAELVRICEGHALALRAVGEQLAEHEFHSLARAVAEIREEGLPVVEALWEAGYRRLPAEAARLYRLLAHHPGDAFCVDAAVALLGAGRYVGEDALTALVRAALLDRDPDHPERFRLTDLRRRHAERRARLDAGPVEAEAALRRLVGWYRRQAQRADRLARGDRLRVADAGRAVPDAPDVAFPDGPGAARWVHRERRALYGSVALARDLGTPRDAWALCEALWPHYDDQAGHVRAAEAFAVGVETAQADENPRAVARLRCQLAQALWTMGEIERAGAALEPAVTAADGLDDDRLRASVLEFAGKLRLVSGEPAAAARWFEAAREVHEHAGNGYGVLLQIHLLGRARRAAGRTDEARELLADAHARARALGHERMTGRTAQELAACCRELGESATALDWYRTALASAERRAALPDQVTLHAALADLTGEDGDQEAAAGHRRRATALLAELTAEERAAEAAAGEG